ncbi:uncharacterized protein LOC112521043 [Cynara cardunculus var. scolymus]|uniref:Uncharacterized protein n=1 Tax=Cynara cardunculus var. scolymus TaxID=59895 RepID=A0A103XGJ7_CYNCS|nr:uncharacterized protein LOC112521043 [Cynara cardunculus var. scolymus]KVH90373.1 hypothetical protein Ccrd_007608 [Cynara cardunculus var. scolymus]
MSTRSRRLKWHPTPPPPSPKIINLPTRHGTRRKKTRPTVAKQPTATSGTIQTYNYKGKLESLFGVEREFTRAPVVLLNSGERRERVGSEEEVDGGGGELAEEKWRFQAEILRAECNFLRMERKFALKKLEKNRVRIERTLKSALENLASGRKKLCEGKNMELVLAEEMKELAEKLEDLQSSYNGSEDRELRKCKNFDKKASRLQRRLEKLGGLTDDECKKEIKNEARINEDISILDYRNQTKSTDVEMLERKMEGLSKGMIDRMEKEYGSILNASVASSASTSKRIDVSDQFTFSNRYSNQTKEPLTSHDNSNKCSGRCKVLVRRIVEQVRAETEQWSQMQEMLGQLRQEMEELQTSKDFWETQALASANEIRSLECSVEEWRGKAIEYETKANKLQTEGDLLKDELEKLKEDQAKEVALTPKKTMLSLSKQIERETKSGLSCRMKGNCEKVEEGKKDSQPLSLAKQLAREKRILISRLKENRGSNNEGLRKGYNLVRSPFKDIGNSSSSSASLVRQNSNAIFPLHYLEPARMEDSFWK